MRSICFLNDGLPQHLEYRRALSNIVIFPQVYKYHPWFTHLPTPKPSQQTSHSSCSSFDPLSNSSIMGVISYEHEIISSIPPAKIFKAFILDSDNLIPKVLPQAIKCVEIIEGDGGPGSIKKITFGEG